MRRRPASFDALQLYDTDGDLTTLGDQATDQYTGKKSEWLFLADGYFDLGTWRGITPVRRRRHRHVVNSIFDFVDDNVITGGQGWAPTGHKWNLAWALHAGAGIQVTNNMTIDVEYSFVNLGDAQTGPFQNVDPITYPYRGGVCSPMASRTSKPTTSSSASTGRWVSRDHGRQS